MDSGKYSCKCWRRGYAGADFKSPESNPVWIKVFDHSPPPLFSVSPKHAVYSSGEFVTFTCSAPDNRRKSKIQFFSDKRLLHLTLSSSVLVTFTHSLCLSPQDSGNYSCMYHVVEAGREIPSQRSSSIFIPVMESPPANLSLQPERPVYIHREEVTLNCSAPEGLAVEGYTFFKERREQSSSELPRRELGSYEVLHVGEDTTGNYTCVYWMLCSGQEILSPQSNLVSVAMTEPPPPPVLTMDPPSGELDEGGSLQLTCSANGSNPDRRFHFYRDGLEMASREEGSLKDSSEPGNASQGASVNILQAKPNHSGEFACRYEEESSGWWVPSPWSQTVNVTGESFWGRVQFLVAQTHFSTGVCAV
ncbi:alpha-1B-glycoprotein-like [Rhineura floridana]|uniref:alpha-1B-glycoprotein-like n=1 Tax=Rhineura floridana TaxID=261503 RepID=UPI002AC7EFB2|nr:alpha-1B-glycoprotein-like [Rhineura floridana]